MELPAAANSGMRPRAVKSPRWVMEESRMPWLTHHCLSVNAMTGVKPVVEIVVMMEVMLRAKTQSRIEIAVPEPGRIGIPGSVIRRGIS